jgi:hypothetical protein
LSLEVNTNEVARLSQCAVPHSAGKGNEQTGEATHPFTGSRAEFEKLFLELPKHIKEQLLQDKLRLADQLIYTIKPVKGAKTIKMFESQDVKEVGLPNISNAKLPKNMALLVSGIYLLQGKATSLEVDDVKTTTFETIESVGAIAIGEF